MNNANNSQNEREDDILSKASTLSMLSQSHIALPNDDTNEYPANVTTTSTNTTVATTIKSGKRIVSPQRNRKEKHKKEIADDGTVESKASTQLADKAWDKLIQALNLSGNLALASSIELFKVTVLPSINLTKTYIVPEITSKLLNSIDENISQRIVDWSNVGLVFCNKIMELMRSRNDSKKQEDDGPGFTEKIGLVGNSFVEFVSSDQGRQCLVDGVALYVKCMDALRTPASKAYLDQMTIFILRIIECISSSSFQQLLLDVQEFIWSTIQTLGDSDTIEAIAEVTADVCHALEMEQYYYKHKKRRCIPKANRARRRKERGRRNLHVKSRNTFSSVAAGENTTEEVLKSALGDGTHHFDTQSCMALNEGRDRIPQQINITSSSAGAPPTMEEDTTDFHSFVQQRQEQLSSLPDIEDLNANSSILFWKRLDATLSQKRADKISSISKKKDDSYHPNAITTSALKEDLGLKTLSALATTPLKQESSSKKWIFFVLFILLLSCFMLIVSCLGIYGLYTLLSPTKTQVAIQQPQEVVIRIVYENQPEDGQVLNNMIKTIQVEHDDTSMIAPILRDVL